MAARHKNLTAAEAWADHQLSPYWEKALLGLIAAERYRQAAAGVYDALGQWDIDVLPWSAIILAALWDERRPLRPRQIADWGTAVGRKAGMPTLRTTLAQMAQTKVQGGAGGAVIVKDEMLYRLGDDLRAYFTERATAYRAAEFRWGWRETAIADRGTGDLKMGTDQQLANMTKTVAAKEVRVEIARRVAAGVWSGAVYVEEGAAVAPAVVASGPEGAAVAAKAVPPEDVERGARIAKIREEMVVRFHKLPARPADGSNAFSDDEAFLFDNIPPEWLTDKQRDAFDAWLRKPMEEEDPIAKAIAMSELHYEADAAQPGTPRGDGVSLYSGRHPEGTAVAEDISSSLVEAIEEVDGDGGEAGQADDTPSDIDVIYPTEDELAAILRGEVVGPAAPMGFEESLEEDS